MITQKMSTSSKLSVQYTSDYLLARVLVPMLKLCGNTSTRAWGVQCSFLYKDSVSMVISLLTHFPRVLELGGGGGG